MKILLSVIPISQVSLLDDMAIVCGALTNLNNCMCCKILAVEGQNLGCRLEVLAEYKINNIALL